MIQVKEEDSSQEANENNSSSSENENSENNDSDKSSKEKERNNIEPLKEFYENNINSTNSLKDKEDNNNSSKENNPEIPSLLNCNNENKNENENSPFKEIHETNFGLNVNNSSKKVVEINIIEDNENKKDINNNNNDINNEKSKEQKEQEDLIKKEQEENRRLIIEAQQKKLEEDLRNKKIIQTYIKLKKTLLQACVDIEENLNKIYFPENSAEMMALSHLGQTASTRNLNLNHTEPFYNNNNIKKNIDNTNLALSKKNNKKQKLIKDYQYRIIDAQTQLDLMLKLNGVNELETLLESKKKYLEQLKAETLSLISVNDLQNKGKEEYNKDTIKRQALINVNEKINRIKEESRIKKDYYKVLQDKIRNQEKNMNEIQSKCDLIKQNIKYFKNLKDNEIKKEKFNINSNNVINSEENNYNYNNNLEQLKEENVENIQRLNESKKLVKLKIKEQTYIINNLNTDMENLSNVLSKTKNDLKTNLEKISDLQFLIRKKESEYFKKLNALKESNDLINERKPFYLGAIKNQNKKIMKSFDHIKFMQEYEKRLKEKEKAKETENKTKKENEIEHNKKSDDLLEIEKLKSDIENTIKNSELNPEIEQILKDIKYNNDPLAKFLEQNQGIQGLNFYVTEGANLQLGANIGI